jgi:hypothetical protein
MPCGGRGRCGGISPRRSIVQRSVACGDSDLNIIERGSWFGIEEKRGQRSDPDRKHERTEKAPSRLALERQSGVGGV